MIGLFNQENRRLRVGPHEPVKIYRVTFQKQVFFVLKSLFSGVKSPFTVHHLPFTIYHSLFTIPCLYFLKVCFRPSKCSFKGKITAMPSGCRCFFYKTIVLRIFNSPQQFTYIFLLLDFDKSTFMFYLLTFNNYKMWR